MGVYLLADTETLTLSIVTAILAFLGTVFSGTMAYLMAKLNTKQAEAAVKVAEVATKQDVAVTEVREVKSTLLETTSKQDAKLEQIHKATNGLVVKLEQASFARGVESEKHREDKSNT